MKSIEEIKVELTLMVLRGEFVDWKNLKDLPIDDDLRTFICKLGAMCSYYYAKEIDKCVHNETRTASCKSPMCSYYYAYYVEKKPHNETREGAYKDPYWKQYYKEEFGE